MARKPQLHNMPAILALFTNIELATALGLKYETATAMKRRGWVDPAYWLRLRAAVNERGYPLRAEMLERFAHERGPSLRSRPSPRLPVQGHHRRSTSATGPPP